MNTDFSGNVSSSFVIAGGSLTITPNHYFNSTGAVNFNGNLVTVQSDATGTGAIGFITNGSAVSGATNVTVERYIPRKRAWRLITSPITTATINAAWQEGNLWDSTTQTRPPANHLGTLITGYAQGTGTNANAHGYDFWGAIANSNSSIRYYVPATTSGTWTSLSSISGVKISDYPAYMLFVRGDRSVTYDTGYTVLRANGTLQQADNIPFTVDRTKAFTVVGNPYASSVDFEKIYTASSGVRDRFWVWNSSLGNYGAYSLIQRNSANIYSIVPSPFNGTGTQTPNAQYIQSGEGFLVQPSSTTTNGTITIGESAKSPSQTAFVSTFRLVPDTDKKLWVNLNLANGTAPATLADGVMMRFDASYDTAITDDDAQKAANFNENLGITRSGIDLTTEARADVATSDTVMLKLWNVTMRGYQLQVMAANWAGAPATHAFIEDNYLKTKQEIDLSGGITTIDFSVTNDAASAASDRFRVVFQNDAVLPVTLIKINAVAGNAGVNISWTVTNEVNIKQYTVERSTDGGRTYTAVASTPARNGGSAISSYSQIDAQPTKGDNLYRIRIETAEGNLSYSPVVKVTVAETSSGVQITLYPNPINKNGRLNLQLNNVAPGSYLVSVYSEDGKRIYGKKIVVAQANVIQSETVNLGSALAQGSYRVIISDNKGKTVFTDKILVQR